MYDAIADRALDPWFWSMITSGVFAIASLMCGLLIWAFKPTNVDPNARTFFHLALAVFVLRRFIGVVTVSNWIFDWVTVTVTGLIAFATVVLLLAIQRAVERDMQKRARRRNGQS